MQGKCKTLHFQICGWPNQCLINGIIYRFLLYLFKKGFGKILIKAVLYKARIAGFIFNGITYRLMYIMALRKHMALKINSPIQY